MIILKNKVTTIIKGCSPVTNHKNIRIPGLAIVLFFIMILIARDAPAQGVWFLENRAYFDPLKAEPRSANIKLFFPARSNAFQYMNKKGDRMVWEIQLGKEIPIFGWESDDGKTRKLNEGEWGLGLWLPVSFHMIEDFKGDSSPIINTDYRFMFTLKFQKGEKFFSNNGHWGLKCTIFGHESTHLGDEFSLAAQTNFPQFRRINVSWEFWELTLSIENYLGSVNNTQHFLTVRTGLTGLWSDGFYSFDLRETNQQNVTLSNRQIESFFLGMEYQYENENFNHYYPFFSVDLRPRIQYNYDKIDLQEKEDYKLSINLIAGLKSIMGYNLKGKVDLYLRYYHGINPHGQFRNQDKYTLYGFGLSVDI